MLREIFKLLLYLVAVYGEFPSSRVVYYLHLTPATWASARETCVREGGHLLNANSVSSVMSDIDVLDRSLDWNRSFSSLKTNVWSGLHRFVDPTNDAKTIIMWHRCDQFNSTSPDNSKIATMFMNSDAYCVSMDTSYVLRPDSCDTKLPYICQMDEGQCWFLPFEDRSFIMAPSMTDTCDLNTCARKCRNDTRENGVECWGFIHSLGPNGEKNGTCALYRDNQRHAFIRFTDNYMVVDTKVTSYVKVCAGGDTTKINPIVEDSSVRPARGNCTPDEQNNGNWDSSICYCDCMEPPMILDAEYLLIPTEDKVKAIIEQLKVEAKDTSANYRKLNSIDDPRPSAKSIGAVGIIILVLVFGGLVLFDVKAAVSFVCRAGKRKECGEKQN